MNVLDQLNAVRNHRGTVRITIGADTVNADVLGTQYTPEDKGIPEHIDASFRMEAKPEQLVSMQQEVIDDILIQGFCDISVQASDRSSWTLRQSIELVKNEQGVYLWHIHARIYL